MPKKQELGAQILIWDFSNPHRVKTTHTGSNRYIPTNIWLNVPYQVVPFGKHQQTSGII